MTNPYVIEINKGRYIWNPSWVATSRYSGQMSLATQWQEVFYSQDYQMNIKRKKQTNAATSSKDR